MSVLRTCAGVSIEGKSPQDSGEQKHKARSEQKMQNQPPRRPGCMYQNARRHIRYHDHRNHPAKDKLDQALEDDVGIAGKVDDTEITPDQSL